MEVFNFGFHVPSWDYPKGSAVKFGRGYTFSVKPQGPIQRVFKLHFKGGLRWFLNLDGTANALTEPTMNMKRLVDFYEEHLTWKTFIYPHPLYGNVFVKFDADSPLNVPEPLIGGSGQTEAFTLQLIEQPL